jgi:antitoxin component HigA of HigAB toxin-antitoxin module
MQMIELPTSALQKNIGSQQEVDQFLMGKSTLPEETLQAICDFLFIRIPLNDNSLIK